MATGQQDSLYRGVHADFTLQRSLLDSGRDIELYLGAQILGGGDGCSPSVDWGHRNCTLLRVMAKAVPEQHAGWKSLNDGSLAAKKAPPKYGSSTPMVVDDGCDQLGGLSRLRFDVWSWPCFF